MAGKDSSFEELAETHERLQGNIKRAFHMIQKYEEDSDRKVTDAASGKRGTGDTKFFVGERDGLRKAIQVLDKEIGSILPDAMRRRA